MAILNNTPREDRQVQYYEDRLNQAEREYIQASREYILHEAYYCGDDAPYPKRFKWLTKKTLLTNKLKSATDKYSKALVRLSALKDVIREAKFKKARGEE